MNYVYLFLAGSLFMINFMVFLWLAFYVAGYGWTLGTERARRKARDEGVAR